MLQPQTKSAEGQAHPRLPEYDSRQAAQTQKSDSDKVVSGPRDIQPLGLKMANSFSGQDKDIWIAATDYYIYFYIIMLFPLTAILQLINFTAS